ncbi:hypothetical protein FF38_12397 [Lucilia cuprina]|uniref:Uncharacterized protein n=1 Tax=Lucilia cuprina TaxID=7375 RepID=A0A0L0BNT8_LUCCU|nr:hypothetical protein FF38_12397 [Lucilia cuprina]
MQQRRMKVQQTTRRGFTTSFIDIEDYIRSFDGTCVLPIYAWIEEFEETAAELAERSNINYNSLMQYIIDGINGSDIVRKKDTGSKYNVMRPSIFRQLRRASPDSTLAESNFYLSNFVHKRKHYLIKTIGNTDFLVTIGEENFALTFHVVPDDCMDIKVVQGLANF